MDNQTEPVAPVGDQAPVVAPKQWVRVIATGIDLRAELTREQVDELLKFATALVAPKP